MQKLKNSRIGLLLSSAFMLFCLAVLAQTAVDLNSSVGNAERMRRNLNEPNAVNPASNNIQKYERKNAVRVETFSPDENLSNTHHSGKYSSESKPAEKK